MSTRTIDMHTHTDNSFDGNHSPIFMCETAVKKGVRAIAFTDHCEVDNYVGGNHERSVRQAFFEVAKARSAYIGQLIVLNGIELGQPHYDIATAEKILNTYAFDIVIGSVHNLRGRQDFYDFKDFTAFDRHALMKEYFDEILQMIEWGGFDTLAHITYPFRYIYARNEIYEEIDDYRDQVDEILSLLAEKDKSLEINTAGLRQPIKRLSAEAKTVKRFRELGGKTITYGSDAHFAKDIAAGFREACEAAKYAGFDSLTLYQQRQAIEIGIE